MVPVSGGCTRSTSSPPRLLWRWPSARSDAGLGAGRCVLGRQRSCSLDIRANVANFSVALDRPFKNAGRKSDADFITIVAWRQLGQLALDYLARGQQCAFEARLQIRSYHAEDGTRHRVAAVVADQIQFLAKPNGTAPTGTAPEEAPVSSEEVPF